MLNRVPVRRVLVGGLLGLVLVAAAWLRFSYADWDDGYQLHPDERAILFVAQDIHLPQSLNAALNARHSPLNPYRDADGDLRLFAYGSLPLYLETSARRALAALCASPLPCARIAPDTFAGRLVNSAHKPAFDQLTFIGRALSALFDTLTVLLVYLLAVELFEDKAAGLLASALLAVAVIHVQNAHFGTFDSPLAFFCTLSLWMTIRFARSSRPVDSLAAGLAAGLAMGCKATAVLLLVPILAVHLRPKKEITRLQDLHIPRLDTPRWLALTAAAALLVFLLTNPYAALDWSGFSASLGSQVALFAGSGQPEFALQFSGTLPLLYGLDQLARWGFGLPLALVCDAGFLWFSWQAIHSRSRAMLALAAWVFIAGVILTGGGIRFPRYLLPVTPSLIVMAAGLLTVPAHNQSVNQNDRGSWRGVRLYALELPMDTESAPRWKAALAAVVLLITAANAIAYINMLQTPHPWLAASRWIYQNIPPGAVLVDEANDDALPLDLAGADGYHLRDQTYQARRIDPLAEPDDCAKIASLSRTIAGSDYLSLASSRLYGVAPRLRDRFPLTASYYSGLMSGALGFDLLRTFSRYPNLAGWSLVDDPFVNLKPPDPLMAGPRQLNIGRVDESFTVYDHPLVLLFANRHRLPAGRIEQTILGASVCP